MEYSGRTTSHSHKFEDWKDKEPDGKPAIQTQIVVEAQWSNMPVEAEDIVRHLWFLHELGNDLYYLKTSIREIEDSRGEQVEVWNDKDVKYETQELDVTPLTYWLRQQGLEDDQKFLLHWWW